MPIPTLPPPPANIIWPVLSRFKNIFPYIPDWSELAISKEPPPPVLIQGFTVSEGFALSARIVSGVTPCIPVSSLNSGLVPPISKLESGLIAPIPTLPSPVRYITSVELSALVPIANFPPPAPQLSAVDIKRQVTPPVEGLVIKN